MKSIPNKKIAFLEFVENMPPRRILFRRTLEEVGYTVTPIYWNRENSNNCTHTEEPQVHLQAGKMAPSLLLMMPSLWRGQWRWLRKLSPKVIVAGHFFLLPLAIAWRLYHGWKQVHVFYDAIEHFAQHFSSYFGPLQKIAYPFLVMSENVGAALCSGVLAVDSRDDRIERRLRRCNRQTIVIWNVPSKKDDPEIEQVESLKGKYSGRKVVAFVGGLMKEKGVRTAIEVAAMVKERYDKFLVLFIGPIMDDPDSIHNLIQSKGVEDNVLFLDPIPCEETVAHLRHSQMGLALHQQHLCHRNLSAGNGRKFFAYMQAGIPIVGPSFGEVGKAVEMADCGILVDTEKANIVAKAIIHLLDNPKEAQRLGLNGRRAFEARFNWERESKKFELFMQHILK